MFLDPSDGGFSYHQFSYAFDSIFVKIDQMDRMILYSRSHRMSESNNNPNLFGLMLPMMVKQNGNGDLVRC